VAVPTTNSLSCSGHKIWDNYSSHTSHDVRDWTSKQPWLKVVPLPPYAPELNPVELLWKIVKDAIANRAFRSIQSVVVNRSADR